MGPQSFARGRAVAPHGPGRSALPNHYTSHFSSDTNSPDHRGTYTLLCDTVGGREPGTRGQRTSDTGENQNQQDARWTLWRIHRREQRALTSPDTDTLPRSPLDGSLREWRRHAAAKMDFYIRTSELFRGPPRYM
uniref:Uncharacterized protein n=1 Tax=Knipowitschia caucasica TaxID=637954 RepID=A0AAV2KPG5_KNICA